MRLPLLATVALVACGSTEPPPATPTPGPHWPGPVAFAAERDGSLDVFVRDGDRTRRLTRGKRDEFSPSWSEELIAYRVNPPRDDAGDIWTMRPDGTGKRNLTRSPGVPDWSPSFSPDGRMGGMDADGANPRKLTQAGELSEYPRWSPDGRALVFGGNRGGDFEVLRIDAAGGEEHNLTRTGVSRSYACTAIPSCRRWGSRPRGG